MSLRGVLPYTLIAEGRRGNLKYLVNRVDEILRFAQNHSSVQGGFETRLLDYPIKSGNDKIWIMTTVAIVIPVYNEEEALPGSIVKLRDFLSKNIKHDWHIVIADNASTDKTWDIAQSLTKQYNDVISFHIDQKGRGRALRKVWLESKADIVSYMDVDLSTGLDAFPKLVQAILDGADIAIGSRLMRGSKTTRGLKREFTSRSYNLIIRMMFFTRLSDAQCGFKAVSRDCAQKILPLTRNNEWFFDTEMLLLAMKNGYKIAEVPVTWVDDPGTTVNIKKTVIEDLKGLARIRFHRMPKPQ